MVSHRPAKAHVSGTAGLIALTVAVGALAGAAVSVLAFFLARYGPSGGNWSFRGNGALAASTVFPAVLASGWTALVLHGRSHGAWPALSIGAALVGLLIAAVGAALLPVFGSGVDQVVGGPILLALLAWTAVAPFLATRIQGPRHAGPSPVMEHLLAGLLWFAAAIGGLMLAGAIVPAGS